MSGTELFHISRIPFAVINNKLVFTMYEKRGHREWLKETYNIDNDDYEESIRGYMKDGQVFFYRTSKFDKVDLREVGMDVLKHIQILSMIYMNVYNPECFNGMHIGEPGTKWQPLEKLGNIQDIISQRFRSYGIA